MAKKEEQALTVADMTKYPLMASGERFRELIETNLGGDPIGVGMLDRVTWPSGKSLQFIMPNEDGEDENVKEITGVILFSRPHRVYFAREEITNDPPDCSSEDMIMGKGNPGGMCESCPMNEFGTALKGNAKACKEKREVHLMITGSLLPIIIDIPPASIKIMKQYLLRLATRKNVPKHGIETKFSLKESRSKDGTNYAELVVTPGNILSPDETKIAEKIASGYVSMISRQPSGTAPAGGASVNYPEQMGPIVDSETTSIDD